MAVHSHRWQATSVKAVDAIVLVVGQSTTTEVGRTLAVTVMLRVVLLGEHLVGRWHVRLMLAARLLMQCTMRGSTVRVHAGKVGRGLTVSHRRHCLELLMMRGLKKGKRHVVRWGHVQIVALKLALDALPIRGVADHRQNGSDALDQLHSLNRLRIVKTVAAK